jgi:hypothetical protein
LADQKLLAIYLNDHLAGAVMGRELAKRALGRNRGNEFGRFLADLVADIEADMESLEAVMSALSVSRDRLKATSGWAAEKAGRLKLNGRFTGYSPLSRLLELEVLSLGVEGKRSLWRSLRHTLRSDPRVAAFDFDALERRAESQRAELERQRLRAAEEALRAAG